MAASLDAFAQNVAADTGGPSVLSEEGVSDYEVCGALPALVARPADHEAVVRILARAAESGLGVIPCGGRTGRETGYRPERYDVALSTERLSGAVDFLQDDLTAVVGAGMTVEALNRLTSPARQTAGLDPPHPSRATLGGTLMAERSGPMRIRWGRARDRVMRMRVALPSGETHTYGALVVKNVTGYDMNRLFAGSWGTLGVVTELAVRLYKMPEREGAAAAGFPTADAVFSAARKLTGLPLSPMWAEVLNAERAGALAQAAPELALPGPWCLAVAVGDFEEGFREQMGRVPDFLVREGGSDPVSFEDERSRQLGKALADPPGGRFSGANVLAMRASGRMDALPRFADAAQGAASAAGGRVAVCAHAGSGVLRAWVHADANAAAMKVAWRRFSEGCRARVEPSSGRSVHVRLDTCPAHLREEVAVWGEDAMEAVSLDLMRRIKEQFDPKRVLSPGRFAGRI
ncbi:MAG: FAD-binding oxidoreductase [bacterium]|nr:FAD-binding oxidoreductase [bacterium]